MFIFFAKSWMSPSLHVEVLSDLLELCDCVKIKHFKWSVRLKGIFRCKFNPWSNTP